MEETFVTKEQLVYLLSKFGEGKNSLNSILEVTLNALMHCERRLFLENSSSNKGNGYRDLSVLGYGRSLELKVPRDRLGAFKPLILMLYRNDDERRREAIYELYSKGLTTRDISDVMDKLYGDHYSKSKISRISQSFYSELELWRNRPLDSSYKALYIDGTYVKIQRNGKYENECFYIVLGLTSDNRREILSIVNFPTESTTNWECVFDNLRERGVEHVGIIVSDNLKGIDSGIAKKFPSSAHQKCCVHLMRQLMGQVRRSDRAAIAKDLKYVLDIANPSHDIDNALARFEALKRQWSSSYKSLSKTLEKIDILPYLTYLNYDFRIRNMLYTTNWIERFNRILKRTLKIRGAMPNEESVLSLMTSVAIDTTEGTYKYPIYSFNFEDKL